MWRECAVTSAPQKLFLCFPCSFSSVLFSSLWSVCKWPRQFDLWSAFVRPCCLTFNTLTQQSCTKGCFPYQTNINGRSVLSDILQPVYQMKFLTNSHSLSSDRFVLLGDMPEHNSRVSSRRQKLYQCPKFSPPIHFYINIVSRQNCCHLRWCLIGLKIWYKLCNCRNVSTKFHYFVYTIADIFVRDA